MELAAEHAYSTRGGEAVMRGGVGFVEDYIGPRTSELELRKSLGKLIKRGRGREDEMKPCRKIRAGPGLRALERSSGEKRLRKGDGHKRKKERRKGREKLLKRSAGTSAIITM